MSKVKIVCTLGPASLTPDVLGKMMDAGLNVARLNFSHGTHEGHGQALQLVRQLAEEKNLPISVMLDTKGPEIRTTLVASDHEELVTEATVRLVPDDGEKCTAGVIRLTHPTLAEECEVGQDLYIDDGTIHLKIEAREGTALVCRVVVGGLLKDRKGVNVPGAQLSLPAMSDKDIDDIRWGVAQGVDSVALSFVRDRADVLAARKVIEEAGGDLQLIAKIESRQAVANLEEIADVVDGMMIARGDLGVEIPTEDVPLVQKRIIDLCRRRGKFTIVATQMLDSMIRNPRPTRAEANDVCNGVLDGADCVMLSGESAAGKYPVGAVTTMATIARRSEEALGRFGRQAPFVEDETGVPEGIALASVKLAQSTGARAILCLTTSGVTAQLVSKFRPQAPIIALTPEVKTARALSTYWGVTPLVVKEQSDGEKAILEGIEAALQAGLVDRGDLVVITAGFPMDVPGTTNTLQARVVSHVVGHGLSVWRGVVTARACVCRSAEDLTRFEAGDILVVEQTDKDYVSALRRAGGLICAEGGLTSHGALCSLEYHLPTIVGASGILDAVKKGSVLTLDATRGLIYEGVANVGSDR